MQALRNFNEWLNTIFTGLGGVALVFMTGVSCLNMVLRLVGEPLSAAYELVAYFGAITVAFPLGYAQLKKSHIAVDILSSTFPQGVRRIALSISLALSASFFGLAAWRVAMHAANLYKTGELSETTRMAYYPFTFAVAVSCALLTFCLLLDFLAIVAPQKEETP